MSQEFTRCLHAKNWTVDTQIEHPLHSGGLPLEDLRGTEEEEQEHVLKQLQDLQEQRKALIIRNSHTGGHRFAGNCIVGSVFPTLFAYFSGTFRYTHPRVRESGTDV